MSGKGIFLFFCLINLGWSIAGAQSISRQNTSNLLTRQVKVHADLIVLKLKSTSSSNGRTSISTDDQLTRIKKLLDYESYQQVFAQNSFSNARLANAHLQNIYKIKLKAGAHIWRELSRLNQLDFIEYAEPFFQNELLLVPNDPEADPNGGLQDYLTVIRAYDGWQIDQSDSTMVIGIVDTGVNMQHEDLGNVAYNYADPINGQDDDGDGYIDNFRGWDLSDGDNDPTADGHPHGTPVAGMSAATTNNTIGMAGIGFNSKYLPVKIAETESRILTNEYEGIVYAADHGCKVINLSWGAAGEYSAYGQDVINYAVLEKDVIIVAAAGNTHAELNFYPASFANVLSVGATDINDNLASWATYSHYIDIMAPGNNVFSTKNNGGYERTTGSSFASPMVAGAAALVRSHFPEMTALQAMEQLRMTADNIDLVGNNMDYYGKIGHGRLNVQRALSDILSPAIRISEISYKGNHGDLIFPGDTVTVVLTFTNYLRNADNVSVAISNPSENVSLADDNLYIERLGAIESYQNNDNPMVFIVSADAKPGEKLLFRVDFVGNSYTDFQYFEINATPQYFDISDGNLTATISSDGDIGYDEPFFENGNGISFMEDYISGQTGLIISLDSVHVLDNVVNNFESLTRDEDFVGETALKLYDNSAADFDGRSVFIPQDTVISRLDIKVEQKILAWENNTNDGYLIFEYRLINNGDSALTSLNAGLFADWDLGEYLTNAASWDTSDEFGYVFDKSTNDLYAGMALITGQTNAYYAIDKKTLNGNSADIDSIFNDKIKHEFLSSNLAKTQAGEQGAGSDVAQLVGGNGITLMPNESVKITFAMMASTSLEGLRSALNLAKSHYTDYTNDPPFAETFYACQGDQATIDPNGGVYEFYADPQAAQRLDSGYTYTTSPVFEDQIYYAVNLDSAYASDVMKFVVKSGTPIAAFNLPNDTLLIESGKSANLNIENTSVLSDQWRWDFGNGYFSNIQNPITSYQNAGLYAIGLIASNVYGCSDTTKSPLLVGIRSERALVENQEICKGSRITVSASNTSAIKVYEDKKLSKVLFEGAEFSTDEITTDTTFYVVNTSGQFESVATELQIKTKHPELGFKYQPDTLNLDEKYVLKIHNSKGEADNLVWLVNDVFAGSEAAFSYPYTQESIDVSQIKVDTEGCTDTLTMKITPSISAVPELEDLQVCKNSMVTLNPKGGTIFYFYDNADLENPIYKGNSMVISKLSETRSYFVTGMDELLESAATTVAIVVDPVKAFVETSADSVILEEENQVEIRNISIAAQSSFWLFPTGTFDTTSVFTASYDQPGTYDYTLVAISQQECTDTAFHAVRVVTVTGLNDENQLKWNIYPNPVSSILIIESGENSAELLQMELLDTSGKILKLFTVGNESNRHELDMTDLKSGLYFIRSLNANHPFSYKVLKK